MASIYSSIIKDLENKIKASSHLNSEQFEILINNARDQMHNSVRDLSKEKIKSEFIGFNDEIEKIRKRHAKLSKKNMNFRKNIGEDSFVDKIMFYVFGFVFLIVGLLYISNIFSD